MINLFRFIKGIINKYQDVRVAKFDHRHRRMDIFLCMVLLFLWTDILKFQKQKVKHILYSVEGMNFDFVAMNITGFTFYSIYSTYGYFVNTDQTGQVDLNDLLFAYHALLATLITLVQACIFPKKENRIHGITGFYLFALWGFIIVYTILTDVQIITIQFLKTFTVGSDLGVISMMGYFKLTISFFKYLPQFYWNYKRKSTKGWSIANIILDLTGGTFSFAQLALQVLFGQNVEINVVKLVLSIICVIYDILFIIQHYVVYPQTREALVVVSKY